MLKQGDQSSFMGGAELQQTFIGTELAHRGYEITFITKDEGRKKIDNIGPFKVISTFKGGEGIPIIRFFYPRLFKIWSALRRSEADIFYVRVAGFILAPVTFFAKLYKKKVIYCGANDPEFDPKKIKLPVMLRDKNMFYWGLRKCDRIIVQNEVQQKLLLENFNKVGQIIYNCFPNIKDEHKLREKILWVAILRRFKRPDIFVELAKKFPSQKFIMIGGESTEKNSKSYFNFIAEEAKNVQNLDFKGYLPYGEVEKQFEEVKLLVNTSEHEGFPNTFLQAWARGIPVISFVNPDGLITKFRLGLVVNNKEEIAQGVNDILDGKIKFSPQKIKKNFENNFSIQKIVDDYETLFNTI